MVRLRRKGLGRRVHGHAAVGGIGLSGGRVRGGRFGRRRGLGRRRFGRRLGFHLVVAVLRHDSPVFLNRLFLCHPSVQGRQQRLLVGPLGHLDRVPAQLGQPLGHRLTQGERAHRTKVQPRLFRQGNKGGCRAGRKKECYVNGFGLQGRPRGGRQGFGHPGFIQHRPPHGVARLLQQRSQIAGPHAGGGMQQGACLGLALGLDQVSQGLHIARRREHQRKAHVAGAAGGGVAHAPGGQVPARAEAGEGAHPVGAGEQQALHALEVRSRAVQRRDLQQRLDHRLHPPFRQGGHQAFGILARAGDQGAHGRRAPYRALKSKKSGPARPSSSSAASRPKAAAWDTDPRRSVCISRVPSGCTTSPRNRRDPSA